MNAHFIKLLLALTVSLLLPSAAAAECLLPCPGDLDDDCKVDIQDFAILAQNWLFDCSPPVDLPVLNVIDVGIDPKQAQDLAEFLKIPPEKLIIEQGHPLLFIDPQKFLAIPTLPVQDEGLIKELLEQTEQDGESPIVFEALDERSLREIVPVPPQAAAAALFETLKKAGVSLGSGQPETSHTLFELVDTQGSLLLPAVQMDTRVHFHTTFNGIPVLGPGAKTNISFDPAGNVTDLVLARRGLAAQRESIPLISPGQAVTQALGAKAAARFVPEQAAQLVYYAPPLSEQGTKTLIPHYDVGGIIFTPEGAQFHKLRRLVPAIADERFVPSVILEASVQDRNFVSAQALVSGGQKPYRYQWHSTSADLSQIPQDQSSVGYWAFPRLQSGAETLTVNVTDDNGILVSADTTVFVGGAAAESPIGPLSAGVRDFGVSRAVSDLGAANQLGFRTRFIQDGVTQRFNWTGLSAWEEDFKQPPAGLDTQYVDNTDITFYIGHGYGGGFTFESNHDDGTLTFTDAAGAWGNFDLEWLALLSCQVLKGDYGGDSWAKRWGPAFDGLHLLLGFQTNAYDWPDFGHRFADYALGRNFVIITLPPVSIRQAWFKAKAEEQPNSVESVVMGPVGPGGILGGYNDYFWGKGPVSCDLRGSNIRGYWRLVYK